MDERSTATPGLIRPDLAGIPETLLWTLYARAREVRSPTPRLNDPEAVRICAAIDYDFEAKFGAPNPLFALRAALIDGVVTAWLKRHPDGVVASLGEGLETQAMRVDNGRMRWVSVDLPEAIRLRELFIRPTDRFSHLALSAMDPAWMDRIAGERAVLVVAQGLFMYLDPQDVRGVLSGIAARLPGAEAVFDVVQTSLSVSTMQGHRQTDRYDLPPMPWGLDANQIEPTLRGWGLPISRLSFLPYRLGPTRPAVVEAVLDRLKPARLDRPSLVHLTFRPT